MVEARLIETIDAGDELGEGVAWRPEDRSLWWTDIQGSRLHRIDWQTREHRTIALPEKLGSFGFSAPGDGRLIGAFQTGFAWLDPEAGRVEWIERPLLGRADMRFNDGRVGPDGRFWAGTMADPQGKQGLGVLYSIDADEGLREHRTGIGVPNALCWSRDGATVYFADSVQAAIHRYPFDIAAGTFGEAALFCSLPEGAPDGAVTDAEGRVWNAVWGAGEIHVRDPNGALLARIAVPTKQCTCPVFGGPRMNLLIVTSAREGMTEDALAREPQAGSLFVFETDCTGLPPARFGEGMIA
ncbi:MAG: SMP-30/gluconolactonase/LRE family protein [Erythrobacter sp.]|uniref:SMP-30/gluconolactonase/LRE family protein n=1 Tax=Erythrobacter sp. TaxID=1042 RepID=UPI00261A1435|nr:SMP-30/gluconolactonase/LRE family protein [Erythrobacter sp.]MDJ0978156.1 SMP-30/gluconolactonase/LRE family protein [Erythrobacter sp.]